MNFFLRFLLINSLLLILNLSEAQILSNNSFLKGNYVEVGIAPCGSFGSSVAAPSGYHPRGAGNSSTASQLGFVANVAKNNWASYVGDYFLPGTPEEGWGLTVNGINYNNNLICSSPIGIQGGFINHTVTSSQTSTTWQGYVAGLSITAKTYIPLNSLFFVTEVTIQNTSASRIDSIFYMRNVDPDQGMSTPGGGSNYATINNIVYQTPNSCNRALVSATTAVGGYYLGLGSIDQRARVVSGGFSNRDARAIWYGTGFLTSGTRTADEAIAVAFNIGSLQPNQSTKFAYAYILDAAQLAEALSATNISLNLDGTSYSTGNSTNICSGTAIPINLNNTGTFTSWSWQPSIGLNTTTGTSVIATLTNPITYTATGTGVCGTTSVQISLNPVIQPTPGSAGAITGLSTIGLGQTGNTFFIASVANATSYEWSLPPGAVVTSARSDSNVITFNAPSTTWCGNVTVKPKNSCGVGTESSLAVCISNIATGSIASPICGGAIVNVPISAPLGYFYSGNVFTAQLSDSAGSFSNPVPIGSISATGSSFISSTIPTNTIGGSKYRIRVVSSSPATIGTDNGADLVINPALTPTISITANQTTICGLTSIVFTATAINGGSTPVFQWKKNGLNVGINSASYTDNSLVSGDYITCTLTSNAICSTTNIAISNTINLTGVSGTPSISITSDKTSICSGTLVTFTASIVNGGTSPIYRWKKNGVDVGTNSNTYSDNTLTNTDSVFCVLTSNATCMTTSSATSNKLGVSVSVNLIPSVTITSNVDSICSGSNSIVTFTATPVNGGTSPTYQWRLNGNNIVGATSSTYSTSIIGGSDVISCSMLSNATCVTTPIAISNNKSITIVPSVTPTISIVASQTEVCGVSSLPTITYTATVTNGGSAPFYQWKKNGVNVGTNNSVYTDNTYTNGTIISCVLVSNSTATCKTSDTAYSNSISMVVSSMVTPYISISQSAIACAGGTTNFTATVANPGSSPIYQWKKNGLAVGTNSPTYSDNTLINGDIITCRLTSNASCRAVDTAISNAISTVVYTSVVPSVTISTTQSVICIGTSPTVTFRATPTNGGSLPTYQWLKNGVVMLTTTSSTYSVSGLVAGDIISCRMNSTATCPVPASVVSNLITMSSASTATPTLSIIASQTNICSGTSVTYTAVSTNGGSIPTYSWYRNGSLVTTTTATSYTMSFINNNDAISCIMNSSLSCASPVSVTSSNTITMTVNAIVTPSVSIAATQTNICAGNTVTFTATPVNGGATPTYVWRKNGVIVGTNSPVYSTNSFVGGDYVYCTMTTSLTTCITTSSASSNYVYIYITSPTTPSISVSASATTVCSSNTVTFTTSISNGGTSPVYQWKKNGANVGTNSSTLTLSNLLNNDEISCVLTSNATCVTSSTAISNNVVMTVQSGTPSLTISASQTFVCTGSNPYITFTATATNAGTYQYYTWRKNGVAYATGYYGVGSSSYSMYCLGGDIITCEITSSSSSCITSYPFVSSNSITLTSTTSAAPSISITNTSSNNICTGGFVSFSATPINGGTSPLYQWKKNGVAIISTYASTYSFTGLNNGDIITCSMTGNLSCASGTVTSNAIPVSVTNVSTPSVTIVASQSNVCAGVPITFTATPINGGTAPLYQWKKNGVQLLLSSANTYTDNNFVTGDTVTCRLTSSAPCRTLDTVNSNKIGIVVTGALPTIVISTPSIGLCSGSSSATFTASVTNAGSLPTYQWKKNGVNVGTNSSVYNDNSLSNNDTILCVLTTNNICPALVTSNKIGISIINVATPNVTSPVSINCGQTASLTATPVTPNTNVRWFDASTGGNQLSTSNVYSVSPINNAVYYAEAYSSASGSSVKSVATTATTVVDASVMGTSISGIAFTNNYVYAIGTNYVSRYTRSNLSSGSILARRELFFTDLSNGNLWQFGDAVSNGNTFSYGNATRLYRLDENLVQTGSYITLSQPVPLDPYGYGYSYLIASGEGFVVAYDVYSSKIYIINLTSGLVTSLSPSSGLSFNTAYNYKAYGWAEFDGTNYYLLYASGSNINKTNLTSFSTSILQSFTNINYIANVLFDKDNSRLLFHNNYSSQFSSLYSAALGFTSVVSTNAIPSCTSARIPVNVNVSPIVPTITPSGATTICSTGSLVLTSSAGVSYSWQKDGNNIAGATSQTYSPTQTGSYTVTVTNSVGCTGVSAPTSVIVNLPVTPTISITANQTTICSGTSNTFTATSTNQGTTPVYQWKKNGTNVGTNASTYTDNTLVNGDIITCTLTSNATCLTTNTANSNSITMTVTTAIPSVVIAANQTVICSGSTIVFTATATNGGTAPIYQWKKNGINVGTNTSIYTDNTLVNGDIVSCTLTSNATCSATTPVNSNSISITVNSVSTPSISITASQTNICSGVNVVFNTTISGGGSSPIYQWKKNGINVGTNSASYSSNTISNGDVITCQLTSSLNCVTSSSIISNSISMVVSPLVAPSISITSSNNNICLGSAVVFTATATNGGTSPVYQWRKNGINVGGNSPSYTDNSLNNGDSIICVLTSNAICTTVSTATSNIIRMTVTTPVTMTATMTSSSSSTICSGTYVSFSTTTLNGGTSPTYRWFKNGVFTGSISSTYYDYTLLNGDSIYCEITSSLACVNNRVTNTNGIKFTVNPIITPSLSLTASQTTTCLGTSVTFTATPLNAGTVTAYYWYKNGTNISTTTVPTLSVSSINNGDYFYCSVNVSGTGCYSNSSATSSTITISVIPTATVSVNTANSILCNGTNSAVFNAIANNAGINPVYQWKKNGSNVGTNSSSYTDNGLSNNDSIWCVLTSSSTCSGTATSNKVIITTVSVTNPVVTTPITVTCGDSAILSATVSPGTQLRWYNSLTATSSFAVGNNIKVAPIANSTYYAESYVGTNTKSVTSLSTVAGLLIDHNGITSDDRGGIAISPNYVYITGDASTGRFLKSNLSSGVSLTLRDGFFSDISNGDLWQLSTSTSNGASVYGGTFTKLYKLDESLNTTGQIVTMSQSVAMPYGLVAPGYGYVLLFSGNSCYYVNLSNGTTTLLTSSLSISYTGSEGWASYGWSEFDGTNYYLIYVSGTNFLKTNVTTGLTTVLQSFSNLSDMANVVFDSQSDRVYFHHESSSQFGGTSETLGYLSANTTSSSVVGSVCTSNRIPLVVNVSSALPPSLTTSGSTTFCSNNTLTLTAQSGSSYQWIKDGSNLTGITTQTYNPTASGRYAVRVTQINGCASTSVDTLVTVLSPVTPSVIISANQSTICSGTPITFTAVASNAGTTPVYQWRKNGNNVGTNSSTYIDNTLLSGDVISCLLTSSESCVTSSTAVSNLITLTVTSATPAISILADQTTICSGTSVTFTATPVNGGAAPSYQWLKNGNNVGANAATFTSNTLANGDIITCILTSNATCATSNSAISNNVTMVVNSLSTPTISISTTSTNVCSGVNVTFNSAITNGGASPIYQWKKNGVNVGTSSSTYSDNSLQNGDIITCQLTSSVLCTSSRIVLSSPITMTVNNIVTPTISISTPQTTICSSNSATFTASITNGGSTPVYQWRKNGVAVGTNSATYTDNSILTGSSITCTLTSNASCATSSVVTSNTILMTVNSIVTPTVSISQSPAGVICAGNNITFYASSTNGGSSPIYQWRKNGVNVGTNSTSFSATDLVNGDIISCVMLSNRGCVTATTVTSNSITANVASKVTPSVTINASQTSICSGGNVTFTATPVNGGTSPYYTWYLNGSYYSNTTTNSLTISSVVSSLTNVTCTMNSSNTCVTASPVTSNSVSVSVVPTVIASVTIYANTTSIASGASVTFTAVATNGGTLPVYQWKKNGVNVGTNSSTFTTNSILNGDVFSCTLTSNATCVTPAIAVSNTVPITVISSYYVAGSVATPTNLLIPGVTIKTGTDSVITTSNGLYNFNLTAGGNYTISASKNNDIVKSSGINVLDVLLTQRHITGASLLNSPYKLIAADVNNSGNINIFDVIFMKRLILGTDTTFAGNRLWAFVDSAYTFTDPTNPFPNSNTISITNLSSSLTNKGFTGVKLGDVNLDLVPTVGINRIQKHGSPVVIYFDTIYASNKLEKEVRVALRVKNFVNISGLQFTMEFNKKAFDFGTIINKEINLESGLRYSKDGKVSFIWNDSLNQARTLSDGSIIGEIILNKKLDLNVENLDINSSIAEAIAYDIKDVAHDVVKGQGLIVGNKSALYTAEQIVVMPNPTNGYAKVRIIAKSDKQIILTLHDMYGKVVYSRKINVTIGVNDYDLDFNKPVLLPQGNYLLKASNFINNPIKLIIAR